MTVQALPWAIHGQSHSAEIARSAVAAIFGVPVAAHTTAASVTTAGGGHGVTGSTDLAVSQNGTPNMSVNVAAGRALIRAGHTGNITSGCYSFLNDATVNLVISAADATYARYDLVIAQVRDTNYGEAAADARITVVTGTPLSTPADPSLTSYPNCLVLARIQVDAGATSIVTAKITDLRTRAYAAGGTAIVARAADLPTGSSLYPGLVAFAVAELTEYLYDGTGWIVMREPPQAWTPTWTQGATIAKTVTGAYYQRSGGRCRGWFDLAATSGGTAASQIICSVPKAASAEKILGDVHVFDAAPVTFYVGQMYAQTTTTFSVLTHALTAAGITTPTIASGDLLRGRFDYQMATPYT